MTPHADRPGPPAATPPGLLRSAWLVFDLSIGLMLWSRRTIFMALVVAVPVVIAVALRLLVALGAPVARVGGTPLGGETIFGLMIWVFYLRFIVPVLGAFYGTALIADEVEEKTITYLFTRPVRRGAILLGKYFAYLAVTTFVVLPSLALVYVLVVPLGGHLGRAFPAFLTDLAVIALGLAVYGAFFAFVGARLKRPLLAGLFFVFGWEQAALAIPGYLRRVTIAWYLQALVPHAVPLQPSLAGLLQDLFRDYPRPPTTLLCLAGVWAVSLWLAVRAVERREYVLEQ
ncbi:MAG TPA: ABC transporter permease [Vicinamibacterales bacterium]|nr:ABC transporter permease [Vicinamibacterales bacterium]